MGRKKSGLECNECGEDINPKKPFVLWSVVKESKGEEEVLDDVAAFHTACFELIIHDLNERAVEDEDDELGPDDGDGAEEFVNLFKRIMDEFDNAQREWSYRGAKEGRAHTPREDTGMGREEACKILHVRHNATDEEIKAAWRKRAKELHPDLNKDKPNAEEEFKKARTAYETLIGV